MSWTTAKTTAGRRRMAKANVPRQARKAPLLSLRLRRKFQVAWAKAEEMTRRKATRLIGGAIVSDGGGPTHVWPRREALCWRRAVSAAQATDLRAWRAHSAGPAGLKPAPTRE